MSRLAILVFVIISLLGTTLASSRHERDDVTGHIYSTREEILATRERRKSQFGEKYDEMKQRMDDHLSGKFLMTEFEYNRLEKKLNAYKSKLEYLNSEFDDRHIQRLIDREKDMNEVHRARIERRSEL